MHGDADDFSRHDAALPEDALLDLNPEDPTDVQRQCYEEETPSSRACADRCSAFNRAISA